MSRIPSANTSVGLANLLLFSSLMKTIAWSAVMLAVGVVVAPTGTRATDSPTSWALVAASKVAEEARLALIRKAQIWTATDVASMDLRTGPQGPYAFRPGQTVVCEYVAEPMGGNTRKFDCAITPDYVVKVRYGRNNGHVQGAVLATRLLWALGFGADIVYPVRVMCRGCSSDPWNDRGRRPGTTLFDPATAERRPEGQVIKSDKHDGWSWPELDLVSEAAGGATTAQRDALRLLAAFVQHTDTKDEQQRLICLHGRLAGDGSCGTPFMFLHDVGTTFGRANRFNEDEIGSVSFEDWARTPVWRDPNTCRAHLSKSRTGTLGDPVIGEAGRKFLADLLVQLTDRQVRDLFEVARVELRSRKPGSGKPGATVAEWVDVFKQKRDEIVAARCQPETRTQR